ncbi:TVP38/TMEM64 family protein [Dactylosporangium fulvum]|uniref:TVP38/TMEM64 family membrane protein n=1 Tax=Dactylosporangium fulvum TaxID=53359 RepID=A0ABY5VSV1_9ACTN|nr:VTT domain-containing protein [Dactylosporangium fulvum]UWP78896.1 VTT domain-containing protein [Dactylosporangium fulvum]
MHRPSPTAVRFVALIGFVAALAVLGGTVLVPRADAIIAAVRDAGVVAPVLAVTATAVLMVALVPRSLLAVAAGALFGAVAGAAYVLAGAVLAGVAAFTAARVLGRDFTVAHPRLRRADAWLDRGGLLAVAALRLLPVAPFGLVSYAPGVTALRFPVYVAGTVLGMVPSTVVYAVLGAGATRPGSAAFLLSGLVALLMAAATTIGARRAGLRRRDTGPVPEARTEPSRPG